MTTFKVGDKIRYDDSAIFPRYPDGFKEDIFEGEITQITEDKMYVIIIKSIQSSYYYGGKIMMKLSSPHVTLLESKEEPVETGGGFNRTGHDDFMKSLK